MPRAHSAAPGAPHVCSAARTVAALEAHAQHLMLRVLLSDPPGGLSTTDATLGLAFMAMLFNVTAVVRLHKKCATCCDMMCGRIGLLVHCWQLVA